MAGWTNRAKYQTLGWLFVRTDTLPTYWYMVLVTDATAPTADINVMSELTEVGDGTGYTNGGIQLTPGTTDFDVWTEDDTNDRGLVQIRDLVWTASGGDMPDGDSARYSCLTCDDATPASREILWYFDLVSNRQVSDTQTLTLQNCEIRINES